MKAKRLIGFLAVLLLFAVTVGCGKVVIDNADLCKKWANSYEPETVALRLSDKGKATIYDGTERADYKFTVDDTFVSIIKRDGSVEKHRFSLTKEGLIFYHNYDYELETRLGDGIMGVWNAGNNSFEFTSNYTFLEDGFFTGHYSVDEEAGTIKLMYEHTMQDTVLYYSLDGDKLLIEYPWQYVEVAK